MNKCQQYGLKADFVVSGMWTLIFKFNMLRQRKRMFGYCSNDVMYATDSISYLIN